MTVRHKNWEFIYIRNSIWQQHTKEQTTKNLYAVQYKIKQKVKDKLSNEEWALFEYIMQQDLAREDVIQICKCAENGEAIKIINNLADKNQKFKTK